MISDAGVSLCDFDVGESRRPRRDEHGHYLLSKIIYGDDSPGREKYTATTVQAQSRAEDNTATTVQVRNEIV